MRYTLLLLAAVLFTSCVSSPSEKPTANQLFTQCASQPMNAYNPLRACLDRHTNVHVTTAVVPTGELMSCLCSARNDLEYYATLWLVDYKQYVDIQKKNKRNRSRFVYIEGIKKNLMTASDASDNARQSIQSYGKGAAQSCQQKGVQRESVDASDMVKTADELDRALERVHIDSCTFLHLRSSS